MRHINRIIMTFSFILILGITLSCKKNETELEKDHIISILETVSLGEETKWVVVLPGLGCHGCIQEGEAFLKDNMDNQQIFLVLTKVESVKILNNKLGIKLRESPTVYIDREDEFRFPTANKAYPCIVHLANGKYISHEFQSPQNNGFEKLRTTIMIE